MRRRVLVVSTIAIVLFSGCVGAEATKASVSSATTTAAPPTVSAETGSIAGTILDDETKPVIGAEVGMISDASLTATSDAEGKFTFNELAPGNYKLVAQKLGYESLAKSVDVVAGEVVEVNLLLTPVAIVEAYQNGEILAGFFGSGLCVSGVVTVRPGAVDPTGQERSIFDTEVTDSQNLKTTFDTMVWDATSPGSATLFALSHRVDGDTKNSTQGRSPIFSRIDDPEPKKKDGRINHWTWLGCSLDDPTTAVTVVFQQKFTIYVNNFYGEYAPTGFTGLPD